MKSLLLLVSLYWHPIHISVCEIEYSQDAKTFQFSQRIFADDLENAVNKANGTTHDILKLSKDQRNAYLEDYAMQKIELRDNDSSIELKFLGSEIEEGVCWIYYESVPLEVEIKEISIKNIILFEMFEDQTTIIQVSDKEDKKINFRLFGDKTTEVISFN